MTERCIYCHGDFDGDDPSWTCPGCSTRYHYVCRHEMRACGTIGCPTPDALPGRSERPAGPAGHPDLAVAGAGGGSGLLASLVGVLLVAGGVVGGLVAVRGTPDVPSEAPVAEEAPPIDPRFPTGTGSEASAGDADMKDAVRTLHRAEVLLATGRGADALAVLYDAPDAVFEDSLAASRRDALAARIEQAMIVHGGGSWDEASAAGAEDEEPAPVGPPEADDVTPLEAVEADEPPAADDGAEATPSEAADAAERDRALDEALAVIVADQLRQLTADPNVDAELLEAVVDRARSMAPAGTDLPDVLAGAEARLRELQAAATRDAYVEALRAKRDATILALARGECAPLQGLLEAIQRQPERSADDWAFVRRAAAAIIERRRAIARTPGARGPLSELHAVAASLLLERCPLPPGPGDGEFSNPADGSVLVWVPTSRFATEVGFVGYFIGKYEVDRAQFAAFRKATGRRGKAPSAEEERLPASGVSYVDAEEYCAWAGLRLPTPGEWHGAAQLPQRWSSPGRIDEKLARAANVWGAQDGFVGLAPVGSFPRTASIYGCQDMIGNVSEWVDGRPRQVWGNTAKMRVRLGASFRHHPGAEAFGELPVPPADASEDAGFRVARGFWD